MKGFCCGHRDLSLSHLSPVSLSHVDMPGCPCNIQLPTTLESLDFCGHSLFSQSSEMCFQRLKVVSEISLSFPRTSQVGLSARSRGMVLQDDSTLVPNFPCSLCSLHILCYALHSMQCCNCWTGLLRVV